MIIYMVTLANTVVRTKENCQKVNQKPYHILGRRLGEVGQRYKVKSYFPRLTSYRNSSFGLCRNHLGLQNTSLKVDNYKPNLFIVANLYHSGQFRYSFFTGAK